MSLLLQKITMNQFNYICLITGIISFIITIVLFFKLNYPEIKRNNYVYTICKIINLKTVTTYCCEITCSECTDVSFNVPDCNTLVNVGNSFDPQLCAKNYTFCRPLGICGNGYECCETCWSTCTDCTPIIGPSGIPIGESCTTYSCNPYCCESVSNLQCQMNCPFCYHIDIYVTYKIYNYSSINSTIGLDYGKSKYDFETMLNKTKIDEKLKCYYDSLMSLMLC